MTHASPLGSRVVAAISALFLSVVLIGGTVTTPATAATSTASQTAGAYVGVVA